MGFRTGSVESDCSNERFAPETRILSRNVRSEELVRTAMSLGDRGPPVHASATFCFS